MSTYLEPLDREGEEAAGSANESHRAPTDGPVGRLGPNEAPSACGSLRERLLVAANGSPLRTLVFGGCEGREGSTSVIRDFAEMLASAGPSVLLVDADLRTSGLIQHAAAGAANLSEVVKEGAMPSPTPWGKGWLTVILSPSSKPDSELFFRSPEFASWLDAQRKRYDYVLFDTAPLLRFADGALIGRMTDGVVIVVQAEATRRDSLVRARNQLQRAGVNVIGVVLNRARNPVPTVLRPYLLSYVD